MGSKLGKRSRSVLTDALVSRARHDSTRQRGRKNAVLIGRDRPLKATGLKKLEAR